jgi:hypothetical protein
VEVNDAHRQAEEVEYVGDGLGDTNAGGSDEIGRQGEEVGDPRANSMELRAHRGSKADLGTSTALGQLWKRHFLDRPLGRVLRMTTLW